MYYKTLNELYSLNKKKKNSVEACISLKHQHQEYLSTKMMQFLFIGAFIDDLQDKTFFLKKVDKY